MKYPYTPEGAAHLAYAPATLPNDLVLQMKLDTGAELCCIDQNYFHGLSPEQALFLRRERFRGMVGSDEFDVFYMTLKLDGRSFQLEVVAGLQGCRNVIGMNLLNEIMSAFDGPSKHVELTL